MLNLKAHSPSQSSPSTQSSFPESITHIICLPKCLWCADEQPFTFTAGLQSHVACRDLRYHHDFARILGLGGKHYVDYHPNARKPKLQLEQDDYVNFGGECSACLAVCLVHQHHEHTAIPCYCLLGP